MTAWEETDPDRALLLELLDSHIRHVRSRVREHEALCVPCPAGHWRWGDMDISGYRKKTEEELRADRARHLKLCRRGAGAAGRGRGSAALHRRRCVMDEQDERWEKLKKVLKGRVERMAYASSHLGGLDRRGAYADVLLLMEDIEDLERES